MNGDGTEPLAQQRPEIQAIASKTRAFGSPGGEDHRMTRQAAPNTYPAAEILHRLVPGASFIATMMRRGPTKSLPRPGGTATRNCGMWQRSFLHLPTRLFRTLGCHREEGCGSHSFHAQRCSFKCLSQGSEDAHARPGGGGKKGKPRELIALLPVRAGSRQESQVPAPGASGFKRVPRDDAAKAASHEPRTTGARSGFHSCEARGIGIPQRRPVRPPPQVRVWKWVGKLLNPSPACWRAGTRGPEGTGRRISLAPETRAAEIA